MITSIKYLFSISVGMLVLIMFEGLFTMGSAFDFATYTTIGWISQVVATLFIVSASILCCHSHLMENK
jgi:preprotein translocase subunit SecF